MVEFDHIITKEKIDENDNIEDIVNANSRFETPLLVEKGILDVSQKDCIQLERRGYYYIDKVGNGTATLHYVPDGKSNAMSIVKKKVDPKLLAQGVEIKKSKKQEKKQDKEEKKDKKKGKEVEANQANEPVADKTEKANN